MLLPQTCAALREAKTEEAVFAEVQKYLQDLQESDFGSLPDGLRPHLIRTADDISRWALYFNREDLTLPPHPKANTLIREMLQLFTTASWRIVELAHLRTHERAPKP